MSSSTRSNWFGVEHLPTDLFAATHNVKFLNPSEKVKTDCLHMKVVSDESETFRESKAVITPIFSGGCKVIGFSCRTVPFRLFNTPESDSKMGSCDETLFVLDETFNTAMSIRPGTTKPYANMYQLVVGVLKHLGRHPVVLTDFSELPYDKELKLDGPIKFTHPLWSICIDPSIMKLLREGLKTMYTIDVVKLGTLFDDKWTQSIVLYCQSNTKRHIPVKTLEYIERSLHVNVRDLILNDHGVNNNGDGYGCMLSMAKLRFIEHLEQLLDMIVFAKTVSGLSPISGTVCLYNNNVLIANMLLSVASRLSNEQKPNTVPIYLNHATTEDNCNAPVVFLN